MTEYEKIRGGDGRELEALVLCESRERDTMHAIRVFSRDGNAAKNLWLVLTEEVAGRPRPSYLLPDHPQKGMQRWTLG
jgi:hypothetical protein